MRNTGPARFLIPAGLILIIFGIILTHDLFNIDRQEKQIRFDRVLITFMLYFVVDCLWAAQADDELILLLKKGIESKKIIALFLKKEDSISDPVLLYTIAELLISGENGVPSNPAKGLDFLKKAAAVNYPQAACELGRLCAQERSIDLPEPDRILPEANIEKSSAEAMNYFRQAAEAGYPEAQYRYARAIFNAGNSTAAKIAIMAITTSNSTNVKLNLFFIFDTSADYSLTSFNSIWSR